MRLWSLHPKYLDQKGLVALWREALLAQAVLAGKTRGYLAHPQLRRFQRCTDPSARIAGYLTEIQAEATRRGYRFDASKISPGSSLESIPVNRGQLEYERAHLLAKLSIRQPDLLPALQATACPDLHPLFRMVEGDIEDWEVVLAP